MYMWSPCIHVCLLFSSRNKRRLFCAVHLLLFFLYLYFFKHPDTAYWHNTVHECFKHWLFRSISFRNALLWPSYIYLSIQLVKPNYPAVPLSMQHHRFLEPHPVCRHISFTTVVAIIVNNFWFLMPFYFPVKIMMIPTWGLSWFKYRRCRGTDNNDLLVKKD